MRRLLWPSVAFDLLSQRTVSPTLTVIDFGENAYCEDFLPTISTQLLPLAALRLSLGSPPGPLTPGPGQKAHCLQEAWACIRA